ncbi:MAG: dephospho-CoA kinase [Erysipelotrichaceae bacterium]|jgi:dephospho-CoA kinase|nr:dephospho-CoA kinase [Erysipelotrichaceae bacterium]
MKKIGITGTIAAGKTSVSILLKRRGFSVFNSDQYARMATNSNNPCFAKIVEAFGEEIIGCDGDIDRKKLADAVFHDEEKRQILNGIVHPYVREGLLKFFERHAESPVVFAEVPLLFEAGWQELFDMSLVITCDEETAIARMMEDRGYSEEEARARYQSQLDPQKQISMADKVIYNNSTLSDLDHEINLFVRDLRKEIRNGNQSL